MYCMNIIKPYFMLANNKFVVYDLTDSKHPELCGLFRYFGYNNAMKIFGERLYLVGGYYGISTFDLGE